MVCKTNKMSAKYKFSMENVEVCPARLKLYK